LDSTGRRTDLPGGRSETPKEYAAFLGCVIPFRIPSVEVAARKVFERLGVRLRDLPGLSCCPEPITSRMVDYRAYLTLSARNLAIAEKAGLDLVTVCNGCYETLVEANEALKDDETRENANGLLSEFDHRYNGGVKVKHVVEVLDEIGEDRIKEQVSRPLHLRAALQYGCHLFRCVEGEDIWRKPDMMKSLTKMTGAEVLEYGLERLCCGYPTMTHRRDFSLEHRLLPKMRRIQGAGADCVVHVCPACIVQFESGLVLLRKFGASFQLPMIHLIELIALSMGITGEELALDVHRSPVMDLARRLA
jgi:heterodisulfide reductase subunit B